MSHATAVDTPSPPGRPATRAATPRRRGLERTEEGPDRTALRRPLRPGLRRVPDPAPGVCVLPQPVQQGPGHGRRLRRSARTTPWPSATRRSFKGIWFVLRFAVVLIPVQMLISLALALVLDALTTSPRAVRPADDLPPLRDPGGHRGPDVGVPLQPDVRADATAGRTSSAPTHRSCSAPTSSSSD